MTSLMALALPFLRSVLPAPVDEPPALDAWAVLDDDDDAAVADDQSRLMDLSMASGQERVQRESLTGECESG